MILCTIHAPHVKRLAALYTAGVISLSGSISFTLDSDDHFTLTCISTGGPPTTVTWTKDSITVTQVVETHFNTDGVTATFMHTLLVTGRLEGYYKCIVNNEVSNESSAGLNVTGIVILVILKYTYCVSLKLDLSPLAPSPPSNVRVTQNGFNSLLVTWTPSQEPDVTGYTTTYQQIHGGQSGSLNTNQTSITITELIVGATYSIGVLANSNTLPSIMTNGPNGIVGKSAVLRLLIAGK